jgi:hypothetical protein
MHYSSIYNPIGNNVNCRYSHQPERRELVSSYGLLKHKYSLVANISKSLLNDHTLSFGEPKWQKYSDAHFLHRGVISEGIGQPYFFAF